MQQAYANRFDAVLDASEVVVFCNALLGVKLEDDSSEGCPCRGECKRHVQISRLCSFEYAVRIGLMACVCIREHEYGQESLDADVDVSEMLHRLQLLQQWDDEKHGACQCMQKISDVLCWASESVRPGIAFDERMAVERLRLKMSLWRLLRRLCASTVAPERICTSSDALWSAYESRDCKNVQRCIQSYSTELQLFGDMADVIYVRCIGSGVQPTLLLSPRELPNDWYREVELDEQRKEDEDARKQSIHTCLYSVYRTERIVTQIPVATQKEDTEEADTQEADTQEADNQEADTQKADTEKADTQEADTQEEDTQEADTQEADTKKEDTQEADTQEADTQKAATDGDGDSHGVLDSQLQKLSILYMSGTISQSQVSLLCVRISAPV
jgi:hypothetical protein